MQPHDTSPSKTSAAGVFYAPIQRKGARLHAPRADRRARPLRLLPLSVRGDDSDEQALVGAHVAGARERRHGGAQHRQPGAQARRRLRGRAVPEAPASSRPASAATSSPSQLKTRRIVESAVEPRARQRTGKTEPLGARRRRQHQHARRSAPRPSTRRWCSSATACNMPERNINDFAGVNLKGAIVVHIGATPQVAARPAAGALRIRRRTLEDVSGRRRDRHDQHRQPEEHGHSVGAVRRCARLQPAMSLADPSLDEARRPAAVGDDESGARRQAVRRIGPHLRRDCSRSSTPASRCRASRCRRA